MPKSKVKIWNSDHLSRTDMYRKIGTIYNLDDASSAQKAEFQKKYRYGEPVGPDQSAIYPVALYFNLTGIPESYRRKWRDFFSAAGGLTIVSKRFRDLLEGHNVGHTTFRELPLYEVDQKTKRPDDEGPFYLMHILEYRDAFVPEQSENVDPWENTGTWRPNLKGDVLAVRPEAVEDADMWMDHRIHERVFFSDRLKQAIKEAKLNVRGLRFRPCTIVDQTS